MISKCNGAVKKSENGDFASDNIISRIGIDLQSNRLYETDKIKKRPVKAISHHTYIICFMENQLKCVF